jgi:hypothetical protein
VRNACSTNEQAGWTPDKLLTWVGPEPKFKAAPQAKETNVYLQYIVSHYDRLPETMVFIHAHRCVSTVLWFSSLWWFVELSQLADSSHTRRVVQAFVAYEGCGEDHQAVAVGTDWLR